MRFPHIVARARKIMEWIPTSKATESLTSIAWINSSDKEGRSQIAYSRSSFEIQVRRLSLSPSDELNS